MKLLLLTATVTVLSAPLAAQPALGGPPIPLYSDASEMGDGTALATAPDGSFAAAWRQVSFQLVARAFGADGAPLTATAVRIDLDDPNGGSPGSPLLAALSTGGYAVVWSHVSPVGASKGLLRILDAAGHPAGPVIELDPQSVPQDESFPFSMTADSTGHFVVGWEAPEGAVVRRFDATGAPVTPEIVVASTPRVLRVAAFPDGRFVVGWQGAKNSFAQVFGPAGNALAPPFPIRGGFASDFQISAIADRFVTVWAGAGVTARLWDANGHPLSPEIAVAPNGENVFSSLVAMRGDGSFLVSWATSSSTQVRLVDSKGRPRGQALRISGARYSGASDLVVTGNEWMIGWPIYLLPDLSSLGPTVQHITEAF